MVHLSNAPDTIKILSDWLYRRGFAVLEQRADGVHHQLLVLARDQWKVRLLNDRGDWSIAVAFGDGEWIHPDVWEACLENFPLAGELSGLDHQVEFLQQRLPDMKSVAGPEVERELRHIGEEYMRRSLGI